MGKRIDAIKAKARRMFRWRDSSTGEFLKAKEAARRDPATVEREAIEREDQSTTMLDVESLFGVSALARVLVADAVVELHGVAGAARLRSGASTSTEGTTQKGVRVLVSVKLSDARKEVGHVR
jgi:hypothetical protein